MVLERLALLAVALRQAWAQLATGSQAVNWGCPLAKEMGRTLLHCTAMFPNKGAALVASLAGASAGLDAGDRNERTALGYAVRDGNSAARRNTGVG